MTPTDINITCVWDGHAVLGEGPLYSSRENGLYWVDIKGQSFHFLSFADQKIKTIKMPERIGWVAERAGGGLICGLKSGFYFLDKDNGDLTLLGDPEPDLPENRLNDAKTDHKGRIWAGSMDDLEESPTGHLFRLDIDHTWQTCDRGYVVANGPALNPDQTILYHTNSSTREIFAFDLDDKGELSNKRLHIKLNEDEGYPDGMTCDTKGGLWVAHWDGWRISRFKTDGTLDFVLKMPVQRPTSICFAGENLDEIYVTSASVNLTEEELKSQPQAGGLFHFKTGHIGLAQTPYGG